MATRSEQDLERLGEPDFGIAGLQIWVRGKPHARSSEPYDRDWLNVTVHCGEANASVWVSGEILATSSFERFSQECDQIHKTLRGVAKLASYEPNVSVTISTTDRHGHADLIVDITPDHMTQKHQFRFEIDQTHVFDVARQAQDIVERFPNREASPPRAI